MSKTTDPWGDPIKAAESNAHRFGPVPKIEGGRTRDAWGDPRPPAGMPVAKFDEAVRTAQERIFEKARPSRKSDEEAAGYVVALTGVIRKSCKGDAEFVSELQKAASWSHTPPAPGAKAPARSEARRGPFGTIARRGPGGKTIYVQEEGTTR